MNKNLFSFYNLISSMFLLNFNSIFSSDLSSAAASSVERGFESAAVRDLRVLTPYERAIQRAEEILGFSLESDLKFRDLSIPPSQKDIDSLIDWWETISRSPGSLVNIRRTFSLFSQEEIRKPRTTPRKQMEYRLDKEVVFKQFSDAVYVGHNIGDLFNIHAIIPLKRASFNSALSVADAGKLELNIYKKMGAYEAFNTFQFIIQEFVKWLDSKRHFGSIVYVYTTDRQYFCEYSNIEIPEKSKQLKGRIYFIQDLNGWVPYFIPNAISRVESPFCYGFSFGNFETGQINRVLIIKPGEKFDIIKTPGFYVQKRSGETGLQVLLYNGVLPGNPKVSMRCRGVEINIDRRCELMRFLDEKLKESHAVAVGVVSEERSHAHTAFFSKGTEDYQTFLAYFVEYINLIQQGYILQSGSSSPFLIDILAEYCQQEQLEEEGLLISDAETKVSKTKRKRKKKKKTAEEKKSSEEIDSISVVEEASSASTEMERALGDASAAARDASVLTEKDSSLLVVSAFEDVLESSKESSVERSETTISKLSKKISAEAIPEVAVTRRSPEEFIVNLVQDLMEVIPEGRMNNRMVMSLLNNWLQICQRECGLKVTSITYKGSHTTLHTNKGLLTFAPKHGSKGDRKFAPGELREKARELVALATRR